MRNIPQSLRKLIIARTNLIYIQSYEENRVFLTLELVCEKTFTSKMALYSWSDTDGLYDYETKSKKKMAAEEFLNFAINHKELAVFVLKDFHENLKNSLYIRYFRDFYQYAKDKYKFLIVLSPVSFVPEELVKELYYLEFPYPDMNEIKELYAALVEKKFKDKIQLTKDEENNVTKLGLGLTEEEFKTAITRVYSGKNIIDNKAINELIEEKAQIVKKEGLLEFIPRKYTIEDIGGLENLKLWLDKRKKFFQAYTPDKKLSLPKGLLMTGISGCGKSLSVQAIATYWNLPLLRLDMNKVFGYEQPEKAMHKAIRTAETVAPSILWIDEIENALGGLSTTQDPVVSRIVSSFLTWLQEKQAPVFVAATANEIANLPAELIRKGRFDEIFFIDLPKEHERAHIFKIHLKKLGAESAKFNIDNLAKATENYNGAEIEQCVKSAMYEAFYENREVAENDIYKIMGRTVPLSTTMSETIKGIRRWASTRAISATP